MRLILPAVLALGLTPIGAFAQTLDVVREIETDNSVVEAADALEEAVTGQGLTVFARIDHGAGAKGAGADIGNSQLLIFGSPEVGTPAIEANRLNALVLPLKVLIYEDVSGQVYLAWEDPAATLTRFGGVPEDAEFIQRMRLAIDNFASIAAAPQSLN